ncbi:MAG: TonB-dependent receptor [Gammaproteobacteria bacterium]
MKRIPGSSITALFSGRPRASMCFAALAAISGGARAADEDKTSGGELQSVTVTARYETEDLQKTPIAISTTSAVQLQAANITSLNTLGQLVPNLYTHPGDADESGVPTIVMRGVSQDDASYARAPAVALYIDDVYHATAVGSELDLTDVDRVEVSRGPQSSLSGNASIGGAIKLYTAQPKGDNSGYFSARTGSFDELSATGAFDTTLAPNLYARVSGHWKRQGGYVKVLDFTCQMQAQGTPELAGSFPTSQPDVAAHGCKTGEEGGGTQNGGRIKLRYVASDKLELNFGLNMERFDLQGSPELTVDVTNPYPNPSGLINLYNVQIEKQFGVRYDDRFLPPAGQKYSSYASYCRPLLTDVVQQPPYQPTPSGICYENARMQDSLIWSGKADYSFSDTLHLTGIVSYSDFGDDFTQNGDQGPLGYVLSKFSQHVIQRTGEVRLNGTSFGDKLDWVAGAFHVNYEGHSDGFIGYITDNFNEFDTALNKSDSGFVHADYKLTDKWRVSGGARYTSGSVEYHFNHPGLLVINEPFTADEKRWDWLLSTDYQITDNTLGYVTVSTGSRPPGITTIVITAQQMQSTPAEELKSYEVGFKNEFFDHKVRLNLAAFYSDYKSRSTTQQGVQCLGELPGATWHPDGSSCNALYPADPGTVPWFISVGKPATVKGFEWDLLAAPYKGLQLEFSGGYNKFESGVKTLGQPGYFHSGNHLQPALNMHADVQYALQSGIGTFTPRLDVSYQSQQDFDPASGVRAPLPEYTIKPYSIANAQLEYAPVDGKWIATAGVTNLTDKFYYYQLFGGGAINIASNVAPPRQYFLSVRRDF